MVYRGDAKRDPKMATMAKYLKIKGLVAELDKRARQTKSTWLSFSLGGDTAWKNRVSYDMVDRVLNVAIISDLRRVRTRDGAVRIFYLHPDGEGTAPNSYNLDSTKRIFDYK